MYMELNVFIQNWKKNSFLCENINNKIIIKVNHESEKWDVETEWLANSRRHPNRFSISK